MVDFVRQHQQEFGDFNTLDQEQEHDYQNSTHDSLTSESDFEEVEVEVDSYSNIEFDDLEEKR
jgi:hypothetical protein